VLVPISVRLFLKHEESVVANAYRFELPTARRRVLLFIAVTSLGPFIGYVLPKPGSSIIGLAAAVAASSGLAALWSP
jgi:hypothetical protein